MKMTFRNYIEKAISNGIGKNLLIEFEEWYKNKWHLNVYHLKGLNANFEAINRFEGFRAGWELK